MSSERHPGSARLRLRRSRGEARDAAVAIPFAGSGLAAALELGDERLTDAQWRAANLCRIESRDGAWVFVNGSHALVCARNGERLAGGSVTPLESGDTIEIGLSRFEFEREAVAAPAPEASSFEPALIAATPAPPAGEHKAAAGALGPVDPGTFDLRELALAAAPVAPLFEDPFGALDIAGVRAREPGAALAEVLGEKKAAAERPPAAELAGPRSRREPPADPAAKLFDALDAEFVRVVRDPSQLAGSVDWEGFLAPVHEHANSLDHYVSKGAAFAHVEDILGARRGVEQVLSQFESPGRSDLLDVAPAEDVLRLFAPELAHQASPALPSLTRREHHAVSPDSPMRLGPVRPADAPKDSE